MINKEKTMKLTDYFKLVKPEYLYVQITPHKSIRNYNSTNIAKAIAHTYKKLGDRIHREQKKIFFETNFKISYVIDIKGNDCKFYFIVPKQFLNILLEKIREIWSKATIEVVDGIEKFSEDSSVYQLVYNKEDALSLAVDKKSNEPLNSVLNVIDIMKGEDRVTIIYNFLPRAQFGWLKQYNDSMQKIKDKKPTEREKLNFAYIGKLTLNYLLSLIDSLIDILNDFGGGKGAKRNGISFAESLATALEQTQELSVATKKKKELNVVDTQIAVVSKSEDKVRGENNALAVCQAYRVLDEDNQLKYKKVDTEVSDIEKYRFDKIETNTVSVDESQNFIQIPGRQLLKDFGIKHIEVEETQVPEKLRNGYISLGNVKYKGTTQDSFIEDDYDIGSLPLTLIGAQGSGKSTFMANYYRFVNRRKEGGAVIDFIKNCEMSDEVIRYLPTEDMIILDYTKEECIQGFAFNELSAKDDLSTYQRLELANLQAQQVLAFVDAINAEQPLQARMRKYLSAAANVVFAAGENSLREVVKCLEEWETRHKYLDALSDEELEFLQDEIKALNDLDEWSKVTKDNPESVVIGTKDSKLEGILDRINLLKEDFKLKYMFNKGSEGNINFAEELEKGKTIIIRMPQDSFKKHSKNVIVTFLLSKIWVATELRGKWNKKPKKTHISVDEVFQCKTAMKMLANDEVLPQTRKFGCKFIFSCQYTEQIEILMDTLIGAGSSFMLLRGTSEKDFRRFEGKLEGFEYEDLRDMQQWGSLNLVYYSGGCASFISKLPPPIKK